LAGRPFELRTAKAKGRSPKKKCSRLNIYVKDLRFCSGQSFPFTVNRVLRDGLGVFAPAGVHAMEGGHKLHLFKGLPSILASDEPTAGSPGSKG
jgi:hypothetical protein